MTIIYFLYYILVYIQHSGDVSLENLLFPSGSNGLTLENLVFYQFHCI